jgi:oxygen-independent coproporphyrinogen-3 oxidase
MLNALRLVEGFPLALFTERTGLPFTAIQRGVEAAEKKGLLERDLRRIRPSERGRRFLNDLLALFLAGGTPGRAPGVPIAVRAIRTS